MSLSIEQLASYLTRLKFPLDGHLPAPNLATLVKLHDLHTRLIVFENLSLIVPSWQRQDVSPAGLKLDISSLFNKIVTRGRGGYCFELNTLFAALLSGLGYNVRTGAARVVLDGPDVNPEVMNNHNYLMSPYAHMVLFVSGGMLPAGKTYLCDVGFGGNTLTTPVEILPKAAIAPGYAPPVERYAQGPQYRLRWGRCGTPSSAQPTDIDQGYYLQLWFNRSAETGCWHDMYYFTLATFGPMDMVQYNFFTSMFPQSVFVKGAFVTRVDEAGGRYILQGNMLKYRDILGRKQEQPISSIAERNEALRKYFYIVAPDEPSDA